MRTSTSFSWKMVMIVEVEGLGDHGRAVRQQGDAAMRSRPLNEVAPAPAAGPTAGTGTVPDVLPLDVGQKVGAAGPRWGQLTDRTIGSGWLATLSGLESSYIIYARRLFDTHTLTRQAT